jgi:hypothetical protein
MPSRRRLLLLAVVGVAALALGGWLLWPRTAITRDNAERIQVGMNLAEVEAILGGPARDQRRAVVEYDMARGEQEPTELENAPELRELVWMSDEARVGVYMRDAVVAGKAFEPAWEPPGTLTILLRWLGYRPGSGAH